MIAAANLHHNNSFMFSYNKIGIDDSVRMLESLKTKENCDSYEIDSLILSIQNGSIAHFGAFRDDFVFGDSFLILDFKNTLIDYGKSCIFNDNIKSAYLFGAKIQKSMQGKGHFSKLLNAMILYCKEKKISRIFLECKKDNSTALSIYKHLGFFLNNKILKKDLFVLEKNF